MVQGEFVITFGLIYWKWWYLTSSIEYNCTMITSYGAIIAHCSACYYINFFFFFWQQHAFRKYTTTLSRIRNDKMRDYQFYIILFFWVHTIFYSHCVNLVLRMVREYLSLLEWNLYDKWMNRWNVETVSIFFCCYCCCSS